MSPSQRRPARLDAPPLQVAAPKPRATTIQGSAEEAIRVSELTVAIELMRSEIKAVILGSELAKPSAQAPVAPAAPAIEQPPARSPVRLAAEVFAHTPPLKGPAAANGADLLAKQAAHAQAEPQFPSISPHGLTQDLPTRSGAEDMVHTPVAPREAEAYPPKRAELEPSVRALDVEMQALADTAMPSEAKPSLETTAASITSTSQAVLLVRPQECSRQIAQPIQACPPPVQQEVPLARTKRRSTSAKQRSPTLSSIEETEADSHEDEALVSNDSHDDQEAPIADLGASAASVSTDSAQGRAGSDVAAPRPRHPQVGGRTLAGRQGSRLGWVNQENHLAMVLSKDCFVVAAFDGRTSEGRDVARGVRRTLERHAERVLGNACKGAQSIQEAFRVLFEVAQKECSASVTASCFAVAVAFVDLSTHLVTSAHIGDVKFMITSGLKVFFETTACVFGESSPEVTTASSDLVSARLGGEIGGSSPLASDNPDGAQNQGRAFVPEVNVGVALPPGSTMILATAGVWGKLSTEAIAAHMMISNPETAAFSVVLEARSKWPKDGDVADLAAVIVKGSPSQLFR